MANAPAATTPSSGALRSLESHVTRLCRPGSADSPGSSPQIPGAVFLASTPTQPCAYSATSPSFAAGTTSLHTPLSHPLSPSSTFWTASCSKLLTSLAAVHVVEIRRLWDWDRPVVEVLPELKAIRVLEGWDEKRGPIWRGESGNGEGKGVEQVTLRHLLTHTSGMAYDFLSADILKWWKWRGRKREDFSGRLLEMYGEAPMLTGAGEAWMYSPGIDLAGLLVARVAGVERLGVYVWEEVLKKVGVKEGDVVFRKGDLKWGEEEVRERWVYLSVRTQEGLVHLPTAPADTARDDLGGGGVRCPPRAYIKVLESLLRNDGRILPPKIVDELVFSPQLVDGPGKLGAHLGRSLMKVFGELEGSRMLTGGLPVPVKDEAGQYGGEYEFNHSLVAALSRRKGSKEWTLYWGGLPNLFWWVDRKEEVAGIQAMQLLPPADEVCLDLAVEFREAAIEALGKGAARGKEQARI
ncbi:uncharacterized protein HMPREF1541_03084 [Cyphellophora europaea CBS 101466]|uniref:Beta-lactamase-related domain-containing protein n=1 Tax=Cyphellophora europaea (strain CBS 101466) TaxID=1220924 RepID=W2RZM9_CYPE1|nr:uncharacterized protein HMPREF1541_03084 [Cyphellophora europaea CBS 101466]ETN41149.1 hypothetical protein HMPREF1541_03084 [Cyphellophora europaea CBS 101466]